MTGACQIDARFFAPPDDLAACFTSIYRVEVALPRGEKVVDYLQPEWANLRFFSGPPPDTQLLGGATLGGARFVATGPSARAVRFATPATRMWGIGLLPLGWARFVDAPAQDYANALVDGETDPAFAPYAPLLEALSASPLDDEAQARIIIAYLRERAMPARDEQRIVAVHETLIDQDLNQIRELALRTGMSVRTLERLCGRYFGFGPRLLLRRQRMMRTLAAFMLQSHVTWSEVIDAHYHDQAHFTHEFHAFMGMGPSEYAALDHPILTAFMAERNRAWGSPAQTLDRPKRTGA